MAKLKLSVSMLIFGTIGVFVRYIPFSSAMIAFMRGVIGTLFMLVAIKLTGKNISVSAVKRNLARLMLSGAAIGVNWILLFEAYRHTTIAIATLCYYMAPIFVIIMSRILLKEKLTVKKLCCTAAALTGMVFVSGVMTGGFAAVNWHGVAFGIGAAIFYASVILINKFLKDISSYDSTTVQLGTASLVLLPYVLITENTAIAAAETMAIVFIIIIGVVHTGIAYWMYFSSIQKISGQTIAIYSYIDPAFAILLSMFLLDEPMNAWGIAGAVLILGSALISGRV